MNIPDNEITLFVRSALGLPETARLALSPIARGGSSRSFWRADCGEAGKVIFMHYEDTPAENLRYAAIAAFLGGIGVSVPRIMSHDEARRFLIMEDLGERDLWSYRGAPWKERRKYYLATLTLARRLHAFPLKDFPSRGIALEEGFTPGLYRWERDYFREQFVEGFCRIEQGPAEKAVLEEELGVLAGKLAAGESGLVHRDFQSQNVMIKNGEPVLIDFQGMRFGNPLYDLGSLLCDPYVTLTDSELLELLSAYHESLYREMKWEEFADQFWKASAQRLMQALGAYGYLGLRKNKPAFLAHIPAGLENLITAAKRARLPRLQELALSCRDAPEKK
jgi:N-acetylmuramate 1-kinase